MCISHIHEIHTRLVGCMHVMCIPCWHTTSLLGVTCLGSTWVWQAGEDHPHDHWKSWWGGCGFQFRLWAVQHWPPLLDTQSPLYMGSGASLQADSPLGDRRRQWNKINKQQRERGLIPLPYCQPGKCFLFLQRQGTGEGERRGQGHSSHDGPQRMKTHRSAHTLSPLRHIWG